MRAFSLTIVCLTLSISTPCGWGGEPDDQKDYSPSPEERQLPLEMHSAMKELPSISVGIESGDLRGSDNRVLQAAVDYIAAMGGGEVHIGAGVYEMRDSLHLRSGVTVRGEGSQTVLRKAPGVVVPLGIDGDFGEQQVTIEDHTQFQVGQGIAVWDSQSGGFHTTVARIIGKRDNTYALDKPLNADCLVQRGAKAGTLYPVISGYHLTGAQILDVSIDGNREANAHLNGCRGGGIFLYRCFGTQIANCEVRNFNGDGISFQQSNDVQVTACVVEGNAQLGLHPGSGSQRPQIRNCTARHNGTDGLFLCWRVRHGVFEDNLLEQNGRFGISIGHKDTDNLLTKNIVRSNKSNGVFFRNESLGMAAHRNRLIANTIENNGESSGTAAIRIRGQTQDLVIQDNVIRDTRDGAAQTQTVGVLVEEEVGAVTLQQNKIEAKVELQDKRQR